MEGLAPRCERTAGLKKARGNPERTPRRFSGDTISSLVSADNISRDRAGWSWQPRIVGGSKGDSGRAAGCLLRADLPRGVVSGNLMNRKGYGKI